MQRELNMDEAVIVWFALAILTEVVSSFMLWAWLRCHGARLVFGLAGIPGYLEHAYHEWCNSHQQPCRAVLLLRAASVVNVIAAAIFAIPILIAR